MQVYTKLNYFLNNCKEKEDNNFEQNIVYYNLNLKYDAIYLYET